MTDTPAYLEALERYNPKPWDSYRCSMAFDDCGDWVKYDDYRALLAALETAEAERDEALNQLDSARHSEECLKKRCEELWAEAAALGEMLEALQLALPSVWPR